MLLGITQSTEGANHYSTHLPCHLSVPVPYYTPRFPSPVSVPYYTPRFPSPVSVPYYTPRFPSPVSSMLRSLKFTKGVFLVTTLVIHFVLSPLLVLFFSKPKTINHKPSHKTDNKNIDFKILL